MNTNNYLLRRRILAWLIDWLLLGLLMIPLGFAAHHFARSMAAALPGVLVGFGLIALFLLRDRLFHGQGIGKRFLGLRVVERDSMGIPAPRQSVIKGLCQCLWPVDAIFLLATGQSLGERCADVRVVEAKTLETHQAARKPEETERNHGGNRPGRVLLISLCVAMVLMFAMVWSAASKALEETKDTESYNLAYQHLVDKLTEDGEELPEIILNGYAYRQSGDCLEVESIPTVQYTFLVGLERHTVICHAQDGNWYVCTACTNAP